MARHYCFCRIKSLKDPQLTAGFCKKGAISLQQLLCVPLKMPLEVSLHALYNPMLFPVQFVVHLEIGCCPY